MVPHLHLYGVDGGHMRVTSLRKGTWLVMAATLLASPVLLASEGPKTLEEQVRHELVMLPYYNVFDELSFQVNGNNVTLMGDVTQPVLKSDAENVVKLVPGVASVNNEIKVLPLSGFDNGIRWRELRAIYGNSVLSRYGLGPIGQIRIIVNNGNVTLAGIVDNQMDKNIAGIVANGVPGVFSVTNNLQVKS